MIINTVHGMIPLSRYIRLGGHSISESGDLIINM